MLVSACEESCRKVSLIPEAKRPGKLRRGEGVREVSEVRNFNRVSKKGSLQFTYENSVEEAGGGIILWGGIISVTRGGYLRGKISNRVRSPKSLRCSKDKKKDGKN